MFKNILANWVEILLSIASVFVLYPFLVGTIGEDQYGVWLLIVSITGYFQLLSLGVPLSTVRHISKYLANKEYDKVNEVIGSCLVLYSAIALLVLVAGSAVALWIDVLFEIPPEYHQVAKVAGLIAMSTVALSFVFEVCEGVTHGCQKFVELAAVKSGLLFMRVALTLVLVRHDNGLLVISLLLGGVTVLQGVLLFAHTRWKFPEIRFSFRKGSFAMTKEILHYSVWALLLSLAGLISFKTDPIVIGSVLSVGRIVYFGIGNNFLLYLSDFIRGISRALMPAASSLEARDETSALAKVYVDYSRLTYLILLPVCVLFVLIGGDFIAIWMGEDFRGPSGSVLTILAISYQFYLVQRGVGVSIMMGISRLRVPTMMMIQAAVVNAGLSVVLAASWGADLDIDGVAWGTTIPNWILTVGLIGYTAKQLHVRVWHYIVQSHLIPSLGIPLLVVPTLLVKQVMDIDSYPKFAIAVVAALAVYSFGAYFLVGEYHRNMIRKRLLRRR